MPFLKPLLRVARGDDKVGVRDLIFSGSHCDEASGQLPSIRMVHHAMHTCGRYKTAVDSLSLLVRGPS